MDATQIRSLEGELESYLAQFDEAFGRREPMAHFRTYVKGQLGDLPRKSIEPIALEAGVPPRTLQQFLAAAGWDQALMRDRLQQIVARDYAHPHAIGIIDETSYAKKGQKTPGVKRQHCGHTGKTDNCTVSVHLSYARPDGFRTMLDGEMFLPEDWSADRERCRAAGIPEGMIHRTKWKIALELRDRAVANGLPLPWLSFDEGYGNTNDFHFGLSDRGQLYAGEVPRCFAGWCKRPAPLHKRHHPQTMGTRRLKKVNPPVSSVENLARSSPAFTAQPWQACHIKDGQKGPIVWEVKHAPFYLRRDGRPTFAHWLIVARNAMDHDEAKYFVSNAPPGTPLEAILYVCFGRAPIERCFEDDKTELGMDHFEVRNYQSLMRHLLITAVSSLFLARVHQKLRGEKTLPERLSGSLRGQRDDSLADDEPRAAQGLFGDTGRDHPLHPATQRPGSGQSYQEHAGPTRPHRDRPRQAALL